MLGKTGQRSLTLRKNVITSAFYKGINVVFTFMLVRFTIEFAGQEKYGIWLSILSFLTWFSAIEVGISNGIRNRITTYFSDEKFKLIQAIVAKGFRSLITIYSLLIVSLTISIIFFPIEELFTPSNENYDNIKWALITCISFYFLHYIFYFLNAILLSTHNTAVTYQITVIQNGLTLLGIVIMKYFIADPSLLLICFWFSFVPFAVWSVSNIAAFSRKLKNIKPSWLKTINPESLPNTKANRSFFIIQLCILIIFSTDNLIIVNFLSGEEVTKFNVSFRFFSIITVIFNLILLPYWASFAEAVHKNDKRWIQTNIRKLIYIWLALSICLIVMILLSNTLYELWIGEPIDIPIELSIFIAISTLLTAWYNIFAYFLNSIDRIKVQRNWLIFSATINIPLSILFINIFGVKGVIIATCITLIPLCISLPIEYRKVLSNLNR